jgi:gluconokinase
VLRAVWSRSHDEELPMEAGFATTAFGPPHRGVARPLLVGHLVVMGVAGAGKSTIAELLVGRLGIGFADGDPRARPRPDALGQHLAAATAVGRSVVVACPALRRADRDRLREAGPVRFVHLTGNPDLIHDRIGGGAGHLVPPSLLPSQLATLEPLAADEDGLAVDTALPPDVVVELVVDWLVRTRTPLSRR